MEKSSIVQGRIPSLDGIRGFAILLVLYFHTYLPYSGGGFIGVDIFFVLSGFLITHLLIREYTKNGKVSFYKFFARRALRLAPAILLLITVLYCYSVIFLNDAEIKHNLNEIFYTLLYLSNWARALDLLPMDYLGHTWSLSIEEQFYIFWPLSFLLLYRIFQSQKKILIVIACLICITWIWRVGLVYNGESPARLYNGTDTRADALLMGCLLAFSLPWIRRLYEKNALFRILQNSGAYIAIIFFLSLLPILHWKNANLYIWYYPVIELMSATLIISIYLNKSKYLNYLFANRILSWLGVISYGLYLWHYPVYRLLEDSGMQPVQVGLYGIPISLAIAAFSYYLIERPTLRLKKNFKV